MKLLNAFSLNMITGSCAILVEEVGPAVARSLAQGCESAVGHADTARVFEAELGTPVPMNRTNVTLRKGDTALVGQYSGPRLPEGATTLPEGATIKWFSVTIAD